MNSVPSAVTRRLSLSCGTSGRRAGSCLLVSCLVGPHLPDYITLQAVTFSSPSSTLWVCFAALSQKKQYQRSQTLPSAPEGSLEPGRQGPGLGPISSPWSGACSLRAAGQGPGFASPPVGLQGLCCLCLETPNLCFYSSRVAQTDTGSLRDPKQELCLTLRDDDGNVYFWHKIEHRCVTMCQRNCMCHLSKSQQTPRKVLPTKVLNPASDLLMTVPVQPRPLQPFR